MAGWTILKAAIADIIKTNGNQKITGQLLQNVLNNIVSSVGEKAAFAGVAALTTNPGTPDGPVFYLAPYNGAYSNFGIEIHDAGLYIILNTAAGTWIASRVFSGHIYNTLFKSCYYTENSNGDLVLSAIKGVTSASCSSLLKFPTSGNIVMHGVAHTRLPGYSKVPTVLFFDNNLELISFMYNTTGSSDFELSQSDIPNNAIFFAVQFVANGGNIEYSNAITDVYDTGINVFMAMLVNSVKANSENNTSLIGNCLKNANLAANNNNNNTYINKNTGAVSRYAGAVSTNFISISGFTKMFYTGTYGQLACYAAFYDANKTFISSLGDSASNVTLTNQEIDVTSVKNAAYIKLSSLNSTLIATIKTSDKNYVSIDSLEASIDSLEASIDSLEASIDSLEEQVGNAGIQSEFNASNLEKTQLNESTYFGMIFDTAVTINEIKYVSGKVKTNNKIVVCGNENTDAKSFVVLSILDIPDAIIGENTVSDLNLRLKAGNALFILGNDKYCSNGNFSNVQYAVGISAVATAKVGDTVKYVQKLVVQKVISVIGIQSIPLTEEYIEEIVQNNIKSAKPNYLNGKILSITGDSEAAGHSIGKQNTYGALIANRNGMTVNNYAINGRKLITGAETSLVDTYAEIAENSDYILVQIGYNDGFNAEIDDNSEDTTTFKGAFNVLVKGLQSNYPKAKIGFIEPYYFGGTSLKPRAAWIKERCEFYHIQCIDGTAKSGLRKDCAEQADYFIDAVHLTALGHERMSYIYENFLQGL